MGDYRGLKVTISAFSKRLEFVYWNLKFVCNLPVLRSFSVGGYLGAWLFTSMAQNDGESNLWVKERENGFYPPALLTAYKDLNNRIKKRIFELIRIIKIEAKLP
jgi:hypothetical protein